MRNNQDRFGSGTDLEKTFKKPQPAALQAIKKTQEIELPSGGLFYGEGSSMEGKDTLELKYMTAYEEDLLTNETNQRNGVAELEFMKSVIMDDINPLDLTVADQAAVLYWSRVFGYGAEYKPNVTCPNCEDKSEHEFDLATFTNFNSWHPDDNPEWVLTTKKTVVFKTPRMGWHIEVRPMTFGDRQAAMMKEKQKKKQKRKRGQALSSMVRTTKLLDMLEEQIISISYMVDTTNPEQEEKTQTLYKVPALEKRSYIEVMPAYDSSFVQKVLGKINSGIDLSFDFECNNCGFEEELEVPIDRKFFRPDF